MIPKICNSCGSVGRDKLASAYWAWMRSDRKRVAYLQKLCIACAAEQVVPLIVAAMEPVLVCPRCGIDTADDHEDVFLKFYPPGMPATESEMPLCGPCTVEVRVAAQLGATRLEDRQPGSLGAASGPQPSDGELRWDQLGGLARD